MSERANTMMAAVAGAVIGAAAGFMFFTERGRALRRELEPVLDELAEELHNFRGKQETTEEAMSTLTIAPETEALKARLKETWMAGDYDRFSRYMEQGARIFYEQLDVPAGCQLLDVACGSGQLALWAARDGVSVHLESHA